MSFIVLQDFLTERKKRNNDLMGEAVACCKDNKYLLNQKSGAYKFGKVGHDLLQDFIVELCQIQCFDFCQLLDG